ncbi:TPA: hypothetical protein ACXLLI_004566, partial [Klebsiella variicola]
RLAGLRFLDQEAAVSPACATLSRATYSSPDKAQRAALALYLAGLRFLGQEAAVSPACAALGRATDL